MNVKSVKRLSFTCMLLMGVLLGACSNEESTTQSAEAAGEIQEVKAKIAHVYPPDLFISKGYDKFAELVNEKSDGKVQFTVYPAGQLYTDVAAPNAVSSGQIEMGVNTLEMWSSNILAAEFSTLPIFDDYEHARKSFSNGLGDLMKENLNAVGAEPLLWAEFGYAYFASNDEALSTPDAFKGKNIRTTSPLMSNFIELAGGSPVTISGGEVTQALQRGTIDAAVSGVAGFSTVQYYEYTEYYTGPFNAGLVLLTANKAWWDGLNEETQNVIREASAETEKWIQEEQEAVHKQSVEHIEQEGMKFVELQKDQFAPIIEELEAQYIDRAGDVGEQVLKIVEENR